MHAIYQQPAQTTSQRPNAAAILRFMLTSTLEMQAIARTAHTHRALNVANEDGRRCGQGLSKVQRGV